MLERSWRHYDHKEMYWRLYDDKGDSAEIDWSGPQCGSWVATGVDLLTLMLIETNNHTLSKLGLHSVGNWSWVH